MSVDKLNSATVSIQTGVPVSLQFDDIYFSPTDGVGESRYHFLDGNHLTPRFMLPYPTLFTVAETGFGTGLNFLLTAELWQQYAPASRQLHYISVEKYPIDGDTLKQIYQQQQWDNSISQSLLAIYPTFNVGVNHHPINQNITLTLLFGDALSQFSQTDFMADAWFLDGFAPAKNSAMWSEELFHCMAAHSRSTTTFATFTAASSVRRGLTAAGFVVQKGKGFGKKRERLLGYFRDS